MTRESSSRRITIDDVAITVDESGDGRPALVLHGGGGPATVAPIAEHLSATMRTLTPTHPGWDGTARPDTVASIGDLASLYLDLLESEGLTGVAVIGNSIGGWLALEMAVRAARDAISSLVLIDSVGIDVDGETITDFFALDPHQAADATFSDGDRFYADPATMSPDASQALQENMATLQALAGDPYMNDPDLRGQLSTVLVPATVIWGDSDGIASPEYGRALAGSLPAASFEIVADAGHLPQIEQPERTFALIDTFLRDR